MELKVWKGRDTNRRQERGRKTETTKKDIERDREKENIQKDVGE